MKKLTFAFALLGLGAVTAADAVPRYLMPDGKGGYNVTYDYNDKPKNNWYTAIRAEWNMVSWKNEYSSTDVVGTGEDKYSMEPMFGGSVSVGKRFDYFWRAELEAGYMGEFQDSEPGASFKISAPYAIANVMYDFTSGIYVGGGLGIAFTTTTLDADWFVYEEKISNVDGKRSETGISPMAGLMFGYSHKLDDNLSLDLRYRFAGFNGTKQELVYYTENRTTAVVTGPHTFTNDIGLITEHSISAGLRYEF